MRLDHTGQVPHWADPPLGWSLCFSLPRDPAPLDRGSAQSSPWCQGWVSWRSPQEPWGWVKCERSSRAPALPTFPAPWLSSGGTQSQQGGWVPKLIAWWLLSSSRARHCTQASKRNTGKDNSTFLARHGTAEQISDGNPTQEHSSSQHTLSCQQTGAKPLLRPSPPHTQALIPRGMNRSTSYFPNHPQCSRDAGRTGELTLNLTCSTQHPTTPEQPCPALLHSSSPGAATCWASMEKEPKKTTPNPTRMLEKLFSIPGLHPAELGFGHEANKEKPTVQKQ